MGHKYYKPEKWQTCSQAVYDLLVAFNNLSTVEEKEEVLDVIYDAFYQRAYKDVIQERVILEKEAECLDLRTKNSILEEENEHLQTRLNQAESLALLDSRRNLKNTKRELLIIVNNLKHYLGESWSTIFPEGSRTVDVFLAKIDKDGIMGCDTWSRHSPVEETETEDDDKDAGVF